MKKLLCLLLVALLSACLLACNPSVSSLKAFSFGQEETSTSQEISSWINDYRSSISTWNSKNQLKPSKWYKISYESADVSNDSNITKTETVKGSGWFYLSPYAFEQKYSLTFTFTSTTTVTNSKGEKSVRSQVEEVEEVYIEGQTYTKTTTQISEQSGKATSVSYSSSSTLIDFISQTKFCGFNILYLLKKGTIEEIFGSTTSPASFSPSFVKNNKISSFSSSTSETSEKTVQHIAEVEKTSPFIKCLQIYRKNVTEAYAVAYDTTSAFEYETASVLKVSLTATVFGFISRPSDYYKY